MTTQAPEYVMARKVLLDALEALGSQAESAILVGAQAVYQHAGAVEGTGVAMTTDGDLALDADLLVDDPEIATALQDGGFTAGNQPGSWVGKNGVKVDLMVAPHQSGRKKATARSASLPPHDKRVARITSGLEPSLFDNSTMRISALEPGDSRSVDLRVAGPAALLVAKLIKIKERQDEVIAGKAQRDRIKNKDALDIYRILLEIPTDIFVEGFRIHEKHEHAKEISHKALNYLKIQHARDLQGHITSMVAEELPDNPVAPAQVHALVDDLLTALAN